MSDIQLTDEERAEVDEIVEEIRAWLNTEEGRRRVLEISMKHVRRNRFGVTVPVDHDASEAMDRLSAEQWEDFDEARAFAKGPGGEA